MPSDYYNKQDNAVNGNIAYAEHVNRINNETDAAFELVASDVADTSVLGVSAQYWSSCDEDLEIPAIYDIGGPYTDGSGSGLYSAKHYAAKAEAWAASAISTNQVSAGDNIRIDTTGTGPYDYEVNLDVSSDIILGTYDIKRDATGYPALQLGATEIDLQVGANDYVRANATNLIADWDTLTASHGLLIRESGIEKASLKVDTSGNATLAADGDLTLDADGGEVILSGCDLQVSSNKIEHSAGQMYMQFDSSSSWIVHDGEVNDSFIKYNAANLAIDNYSLSGSEGIIIRENGVNKTTWKSDGTDATLWSSGDITLDADGGGVNLSGCDLIVGVPSQSIRGSEGGYPRLYYNSATQITLYTAAAAYYTLTSGTHILQHSSNNKVTYDGSNITMDNADLSTGEGLVIKDSGVTQGSFKSDSSGNVTVDAPSGALNLDATGTIHIDSTSNKTVLFSAGTAAVYLYESNPLTSTRCLTANGNVVDCGRNNAGSTWRYVYGINAYAIASDERLKQKITTLETSDVDWLYTLTPVSYEWQDSNVDTDTHYGFTAQDVYAKNPDKKSQISKKHLKKKDKPEDEDDFSWTMAPTEMIAPMLKLMQEQKETIDAQQLAIDDLITRVEALEGV